MDIYLAETQADGVEVYRGRSRAKAPIVGFLRMPEAIRDLLGRSRDADIVLEWEIFAPVIKATREATGVLAFGERSEALCRLFEALRSFRGRS